MPRLKKTEERKIGKTTKEVMKMALQAVEEGLSIRKAAKTYEIAYPTFRRYVKKWKEQGENMSLVPRYDINKVFSEEQESMLVQYYKECALMFYGLSIKDCRQVAFEMVKKNNLKVPSTWERDGLAGLEWFRSFKKRHPDIKVKTPEPVSLARATAFNPENVKTFYDNLQTILERQPKFADGTRVFNLDETSTTTVHKPQKVVAPRGISVGKVTSGEKGILVTTCCIVSAAGHAVPPAIIFPRKNFKTVMMNGAPAGSLGLANPSGWMNSSLFEEVIKHFVKQTRTTPEDPSLLLMDNHESHLSIEALDFAKQSGVTILTFHPHTTHKIQPLDVGLLAPFNYYYSALESWMLRNPGRPVTIYEIAGFVGQAYPRAMTPTNIGSAFSKCGIFPFDRHVFTEIDFMPCNVTDRPAPANADNVGQTESHTVISDPPSEYATRETSPSILSPNILSFGVYDQNKKKSTVEEETKSSINVMSPKEFRPPIKAGPRSGNRKRRNPGKSLIATDTPEKNIIAANRAATKIKKEAAEKLGILRNYKRKILNESQDNIPSPTGGKNTKLRKRPIKEESETDESIEEIIIESDTEVEDDSIDNEEDWVILDENFSPLSQQPKIEDYVLILLKSKKRAVYYVAKIIEVVQENEFTVSYLKLKKGGEQPSFMYPLEPELKAVSKSDIMFILPSPKITGTKRLIKYFFEVNFSLLNVQ